MRSEGFTVFEVLVTLVVVALAVFALIKMQVVSVRGSGFNKESTAAVLLAQRVMEDYRAAAFGSTPPSCGTANDGMTVACSAEIAGSMPYRSNDVTVKVLWGEPKKHISLSTTIAER